MKTIKDIPYGNLPEQKLDILLPECDEFSVLLYFHGGGIEAGNKEWVGPMDKYLTDKGIAIVSADYRMYPDAAYPDFVKDAAKATAWVLNNMDSYGKVKNIFIGGSSAGAYLSMMLCFDERWLAPYKIDRSRIAGYLHNDGQPTCHYNVLRERGIDGGRVIIDDSAALYHIKPGVKYPPMAFTATDNDVPGRYEQNLLTIATLKNYGMKEEDILFTLCHGTHCSQDNALDENGESVLGKIAYDLISYVENK